MSVSFGTCPFGVYGQFALISSSKGFSPAKIFGYLENIAVSSGFLWIWFNTDACIFSCVSSSVMTGSFRCIMFASENMPVAELGME